METTVTAQPTESTTDQPAQWGPLQDAQVRINALTEELTQLREQHTRLQEARDRLAADVAHDSEYLTERLTSEAERRGWCDQYDEIIEVCNANMRVVRIEPRSQEFEIEISVTANVSTLTTVTVTATTMDQAAEMVRRGQVDMDEQATNALDNQLARTGWDDMEIELY